MHRMLAICVMLWLSGALAAADEADPEASIRHALTSWMNEFNARDTQAVCNLFAPGLRYDVQGLPEQNHNDMCDRLHRSLTGTEVGFRYDLNIKEIIVSGDLAVVRLVWSLTVSRPGVPDVVTPEAGMDIFRRQDDGSWKIIRFMAYDAHT
jgi:ketosteroid isomerase-like protein